MSVRHLALVADLVGISPSCKLLLYGLAIGATPDGHSLLTGSELRTLTGLSERAIRDNMAKLRKVGTIRTLPGTYNHHTLHLDPQLRWPL
jgi:hypothetical protein